LRLLDDAPRAPWRAATATGLPGQRAQHAERGRGRRGAARPAFEDWPEPLATAMRSDTARYVENTADLASRDDAVTWPDARVIVALPLAGARGALGCLAFGISGSASLDDDERELFDVLAAQCALAVERAKAHDREHGQVVMLQRALLPDRLPTLPDGKIAFRYLSGTPDIAVGGDWYDAFAFPDGRFGLVVGDVIGKGIGAAAGMARVRTALRALALSDARPRAVLRGLDRLFDATESEESLTTLVYAVLDPRRRRLVYGTAGHPPLLLIAPDGTARFADVGLPAATPLGYAEERTDHAIDLVPGEIVIAFSDGLVENRHRSLGEGLDELLAAAAGPSDGVGELLDRLLRRMFAGHERDDDVTLLAASIG
jgi:hypothetical protein